MNEEPDLHKESQKRCHMDEEPDLHKESQKNAKLKHVRQGARINNTYNTIHNENKKHNYFYLFVICIPYRIIIS